MPNLLKIVDLISEKIKKDNLSELRSAVVELELDIQIKTFDSFEAYQNYLDKR